MTDMNRVSRREEKKKCFEREREREKKDTLYYEYQGLYIRESREI